MVMLAMFTFQETDTQEKAEGLHLCASTTSTMLRMRWTAWTVKHWTVASWGLRWHVTDARTTPHQSIVAVEDPLPQDGTEAVVDTMGVEEAVIEETATETDVADPDRMRIAVIVEAAVIPDPARDLHEESIQDHHHALAADHPEDRRINHENTANLLMPEADPDLAQDPDQSLALDPTLATPMIDLHEDSLIHRAAVVASNCWCNVAASDNNGNKWMDVDSIS